MIGDSSLKNFHCMLNLNKFGESQKYACGSSDHLTMPSINDLLYASKKEIESFNSLYSMLRPNSSLESVMSNCDIVSSLRKKHHFSHHKFTLNRHRKKKNNQNHQSNFDYISDEALDQELAQLDSEAVTEYNENSTTTSNEISREDNQYNIQSIIDTISRRGPQQEIIDIEDNESLSGVFSSSSSSSSAISSRNSTSHSSNRDGNESDLNYTDDSNELYDAMTSSSDEENEQIQSSNQELANRSNTLFERFRMWTALHHFADNDSQERPLNQDITPIETTNENIDEEITDENNSNDDIDEESDHSAYDEIEDNYEDISAIFDSIQEPRDEPSPLHTVHANTAVITATAQLTPAGEREEIFSTISELPESFTDIIDDELNDESEKEKKKISHKKSKKSKKSGLPIPGPMTLEEAFDFISFVKKEALKTSNDNENENYSHNGNKKKVSKEHPITNLC
ncbi:hypothetical protein M9Y10_046001 [Tritrichomonas musculus]|uniref:Uncharacterized protein n=1 Tax=Tritrichomonas musculus TaxID=1915356 RepID=A0ABR2JX72_9EUKA